MFPGKQSFRVFQVTVIRKHRTFRKLQITPKTEWAGQLANHFVHLAKECGHCPTGDEEPLKDIK